jgi:hypothetical protein
MNRISGPAVGKRAPNQLSAVMTRPLQPPENYRTNQQDDMSDILVLTDAGNVLEPRFPS